MFIEFNFTDVSHVSSMECMNNEQAKTHEPLNNGVENTMKSRLAHWRQTALHWLQRAEKRISDNFRVPPGGG
ncbi:hypothetical protein D3C72_2362240 [compost metagenome]